jgi:hypothetical protein
VIGFSILVGAGVIVLLITLLKEFDLWRKKKRAALHRFWGEVENRFKQK